MITVGVVVVAVTVVLVVIVGVVTDCNIIIVTVAVWQTYFWFLLFEG